MASGEGKSSNGLAHGAGSTGSDLPDDDDFPVLEPSKAVPPAWSSERKSPLHRLRDQGLLGTAPEGAQNNAAAQLQALKAENDTLRGQLDKLHRMEARREETRLHEANMAEAMARQAAEKLRLQARQREEELNAREASLAEQQRLEVERHLAQARAQSDARLASALSTQAAAEKQRTQRLLNDKEAEIEARQAALANQQLLERDLLHAEELSRRQAEFDALQHELLEQQRVCAQLGQDLRHMADAAIVGRQQEIKDLLAKLEQLGVSLVVYHAGLGNINLTAGELPQYLENPIAYAARHSMLTEQHYRGWLRHNSDPRCTASIAEGKLCEARLIRVDSPTRFTPGQSDRCSRHQPSDAAISNVLRFQ